MHFSSLSRRFRSDGCRHGTRIAHGGVCSTATRHLLRHRISSFPLETKTATRIAALGPGGGKGPEDALKKFAQEAERHAHQLIDCLTPKHEYDFADVTLILISTLAFMWLAAGLYRMYVFSYYLAASTP